MKKEVLVYDNQTGYYDMLKSKLKEGFDFILFKSDMARVVKEFDAVLFFLHEDLELIDLSRLYNAKIPLILGLSKTVFDANATMDNVYTFNLQQTKHGLLKSLRSIFKNLAVQAA